MISKLNKEININLMILKYNAFNQEKKVEPSVCYNGELVRDPYSCASYHKYDNVYDCYSPTNNYVMQGGSGGQGGAGSIAGSGGNINYCGASGIQGAVNENSQKTKEITIKPQMTNGFRGIIEEDMLKGTCVEISIKHLRE